MGRLATVLVAVLCLLVPPGAGAAPGKGSARALAEASRGASPARKGKRPGRKAPTLTEAKAALTGLMRDRNRRRYRHHWERAIRGLLAAARGKDAHAATLEAARARYALYRWSANEADRDEALRLAGRAARLGSREASALARAIRREAGEDRPAPAPRGPRHHRGKEPPPRPEPSPPDDEAPADPELEAAIAGLTEGASPAGLPLGSDGGAGRARVTEVKTWSSEDYTRVAVYLSHWVGWQKLELAAAPDRPRRFALDLRPATLEGSALARAVPGAQVDRVRAAQHDADTVRVVLELPGADVVQAFALEDPPRLVLDVGTNPAVAGRAETAGDSAGGPGGRAGAAEPVGRAPSASAPVQDEEGIARRPVRRVVVDAGHGGHDPGATGPGRVREKDVTLAMARRLARRLQAAGFEVVLTRKDDRYLALEERTAVANTARADLFVSIHANAHPRRNRSGMETYFLNVTDDRYAARLAARENGLDLDGEREALRILSDLDAKASAGASERLARLVQREVTAGVRARVGEVRDLGVKGALFYVLLGARMPAVLVETAFISNRHEEKRLASARYQEEVAAGITRAVAAYAEGAQRVATRGP